ncbi:MAG: hypothetical protein JNJ71_10010 [Rubrivivax sp.]|nr:hypothetical protein [Rubrivivax sp.]
MTLCPALLLPPAVQADDAAWLRCRSVTEPMARLACYDAVKPSLSAPGSTPGSAPSAAAPAPAGPGPAGARPAAAAATGTAAAGTALSSAEQAFGLEQRSGGGGMDAIRSRIPGPFEGWQAGTRFRLANGQVWQVSDGSSAFYRLRDPAVTIKRGALGSFVLDVEGVNQPIRVRRVE